MSQLSQIFKDIADAIRNKTGSTDTLTPPQMANVINSIPSGGGTLYAWGIVEWDNVMFYSSSSIPLNDSMLLVSSGESGIPGPIDTEYYKVKTYENNNITVLHLDGYNWQDYSWDDYSSFERLPDHDIQL